MSVVSVVEHPESGQIDLDGAKGEIIRKFIVVCDSFGDGELTVCYTLGVPAYGSAYARANEGSLLYRVVKKSAKRQTRNSNIWIVEVKYETSNDEDPNQHPLLELPEISQSYEEKTVPVNGGREGNEKLASYGLRMPNGEIIEPPPMYDDADLVLTIVRREDLNTPTAEIDRTYKNVVSTDSYFGWPAGEARMMPIARKRSHKDIEVDGAQERIHFIETTYVIKFKAGGWDVNLLAHGSFYIDDDGNKIQFKTDTGESILGLLEVDPPGAKHEGTGVYMPPIQVYPKTAFGPLFLPNSYLEGKPQ